MTASEQPTPTPPAGDAGEPPRRGAYGLQLFGADGLSDMLVDAEPSSPVARIERVSTPEGDVAAEIVEDDRAELPLGSTGAVSLRRRDGRVTFRLSRAVSDAELLHPLLAPVAAVMARWHGRESFHAGGFATDQGGLGVVAGRNGGKSTFLAAAASSGLPVLSDDMLVVEGRDLLAGPRSLDLRSSAAAELEVGEPLGVIGTRERWRVRLPPIAPRVPLRGWVFLAWDEATSVKRISARDCLIRLAESRAVRLAPTAPEHLLELAALPAWEARRPRRWSDLAATVDAVGRAFSS